MANEPPQKPRENNRLFADEIDEGNSFNWDLAEDNPNHDPTFRIDAGSKATKMTEGQLTFCRVKGRVGGLQSGGQQITARLHITQKIVSGSRQRQQKTWK